MAHVIGLKPPVNPGGIASVARPWQDTWPADFRAFSFHLNSAVALNTFASYFSPYIYNEGTQVRAEFYSLVVNNHLRMNKQQFNVHSSSHILCN